MHEKSGDMIRDQVRILYLLFLWFDHIWVYVNIRAELVPSPRAYAPNGGGGRMGGGGCK